MDILRILDEIENGGDLAFVARSHGLKRHKLKRELFLNGGRRGKTILLRDLEEKLPVDEIKRELNKNRTVEEISAMLQIEAVILENWIKQYEFISGVPFKKGVGHKERKDLDSEFEEIFRRYLNGETYPALSQKYDASSTAIRNRIEEYIYSKGPEKAKELKAIHNEKMQEERKRKIAEKRMQKRNNVKGDENR